MLSQPGVPRAPNCTAHYCSTQVTAHFAAVYAHPLQLEVFGGPGLRICRCCSDLPSSISVADVGWSQFGTQAL
jgi:hypothetical protein